MSKEPQLHEYPWPKKGDDPFQLGEDWWHNARLNFTHDAPWRGYAEGYKRLAEIGVAHVEEKRRDQDFLVYPIVFSYRQYIELSLKLIIRRARRLFDEPGGVCPSHDLMALWNTAEPLLKRIEPKSGKTYRDVRECLARFAEMDPTSESFRYPIKTSGDPSLPDDLRHINLRQLRDVVERLSGFLDAAGDEISVCLDHKSEELAEWAAEEAALAREFGPDY